MSSRESSIVAPLLAALNSRDFVYARKMPGSAVSSGWPDIIACVCGITVMIECKRPGRHGGATPLQLAELTRWRAAGAVTMVVTSVAEALDRIDNDLLATVPAAC